MKTSLTVLLAVIALACSKSEDESKITGSWLGRHIYIYEEKVVADTAQTLDAALGSTITSTEVVQHRLRFKFKGDSVSIIDKNFETRLLMVPDKENKENFVLFGTPTLALTIVKHTADSLILDEQSPPITLSFQQGKMGSSQREIVKSRYELARTNR